MLQEQAIKIGLRRPLKNIFCIGDNVCTDIFGANLYNRYLQKRREDSAAATVLLKDKASARGSGTPSSSSESGAPNLSRSRSIDHLVGSEGELNGAEHCFSVLVETGVYSPTSAGAQDFATLNHSPRDFLPVEESYQEPTYVVRNVLEAVNLIFEKQKFS